MPSTRTSRSSVSSSSSSPQDLLLRWSGPVRTPSVVARTLMGVTNPVEAAPGTIRGDYGLVITHNIVHGSDSTESAERELGIFFG